MALTVAQKALIFTIALATIAGVGFYVTQHIEKSPKEKRSRKRSAKSDVSASDSIKNEAVAKSTDSPKSKKYSPDSAKKLSESAAAVARGETKLSPKEKEELATQLKEEGNNLFNDALYKEAAQLYSEAIQLQPENPIYYCNRAACYGYMHEYKNVISDCSKALEIDKTYVKALSRRATAYEKMGKLREALHDFSVITALEKFQKDSTMMETDRLMRLLVDKEALNVPPIERKSFPSLFFMNAYFNSYLPLNYPKSKDSSEAKVTEGFLQQCLEYIQMKQYPEALSHAEKCVKLCDEEEPAASYFYNVYGTLLFLQGRSEAASEALEKSLQLNPNNVNTVTKICNAHLERGDADLALKSFDMAIRKFPRAGDLYYHRGQLKFLINDYASAAQDFQKCLEFEPDHVFAHIQLAVAKFKRGNADQAKSMFERAIQRFPNSPDIHCYYGELLMEQRQFDTAMEHFDKAIELGSTMAYIDKAMLLHRVFQRSEAATQLIYQVLKLDPKFDLAHIQLGILLLNQRREDEGISHFDMAIKHARNPFELTNSISAKEHALTQHFVHEFLPNTGLF